MSHTKSQLMETADLQICARIKERFSQVTEALYKIASGKDADLYCCEAILDSGVQKLVAKVYRTRKGNAYSDSQNYYSAKMIKKLSEESGDNMQNLWAHKEFDVLQRLWSVGIAVPQPIACAEDCLLMEFIGDDQPAPLLRDQVFRGQNAKLMLVELIDQIEGMFRNECVHAELTPDNILYLKGKVYIIDFPQSVDPRVAAEAYGNLKSDIVAICEFFEPFGCWVDGSAIAQDLWTRYLNGLI